nr:UDP-glucosyltransferase 2-like [Procambarus clarkii]
MAYMKVMKLTTVCVLVAVLVVGTNGDLASPERSYKILMLLPVSTNSHRTLFMCLAEALADRGHKISAQFPELPPLLDLERNMSLGLINTHFSIGIPLPLLPSEVEVGGMHCRPASPLPEISAQFPELPPLLDLERNMSLGLINTHFSIGIPLPLLPSEVEVGGMHCRPASPLPEELESLITGAGSAGVIYFSLGSVAQSISIPVQYRDLLVQAFRRLPQRVLWKYEGKLEGLPDNVIISKWFPQQDVLAHHNVKVFITHGGLLSLQEAIFHATPLLVLPIFSDQPRNGMFVRNSGLGDFLEWSNLTEDIILKTLTEIINNTRYKENVMRMSAGMRDQPTSPRDRAVFWTEYVIRHRGAPQLRSPAAQLSWVEFLMLDVLLLLLLALSLLCFILRRILIVVSVKMFGSGSSKKKQD